MQPLTLPDEVVLWLRRELGCDLARSADLETTYAFTHPLNARRSLRRLWTPAALGFLRWWLDFFDASSSPVLDQPLARAVAHQMLRSNPERQGVVASNLSFHLKPEFRRQGFGAALYASEAVLYERWRVVEVHIDAHEQGPAVWIKRFGFNPEFPDELLADYRQWARRSRVPQPEISGVRDLPDQFLNAKASLRLYKVLRDDDARTLGTE